jgi:hypothetical protein
MDCFRDVVLDAEVLEHLVYQKDCCQLLEQDVEESQLELLEE